MVKMRGVQVKAGIFDEKIHDLGVKWGISEEKMCDLWDDGVFLKR